MSLEDLNEKIYKPNSQVEHEVSKYDPMSEIKEDEKEFKEDEKKKWVKEKREITPDQKKAMKIGAYVLGGLVVILSIFFIITKVSQGIFNEKNVSISIQGESEVEGNQSVKYKIIVKNNNWVSLKNAKISLNYSENFIPQEANNLKIEDQSNSYIDVGKVRFKSQVEYEVSGKFFAPHGFMVYLNGTLSYSPSVSNNFFQTKNQFGVDVKDSPISLEVLVPQQLASGSQVEYLVDYKNNSTQTFDNIQLKVEYPDSFSFLSSNQETADANNLWNVGTLKPGQEGKITIQGILSGAGSEVKILKAYVGTQGASGTFVAYNQQYSSTKLVDPPLVIAQSIDAKSNHPINPGETISYVINYKNQSNVGYTNAIITFGVNDIGSILDFSHMKSDKGGYFDAVNRKIIWRASDIPGLAIIAPGQAGTINLSIPVLNTISIKNENSKNFKVVTVAEINSPDLPNSVGTSKLVGSNTLELKLNSKVILSTTGFYDDANISNYGPLPPKLGQETSYVIHWKILNVSNDIGQVQVSSSLPAGMKWTGKIYPENEKIEYNSRTNQIVWQAGVLKSATGILSSAREVSFQIALVPQPNQVDQSEVDILNPSILTAKDLFTNSDIKIQNDKKTTRLPEDAKVGGNYSVTQ